jgi:hypothetical protein
MALELASDNFQHFFTIFSPFLQDWGPRLTLCVSGILKLGSNRQGELVV